MNIVEGIQGPVEAHRMWEDEGRGAWGRLHDGRFLSFRSSPYNMRIYHMRLARHTARMTKTIVNAFEVATSEGKRPLPIPKRRWKLNSERYVK